MYGPQQRQNLQVKLWPGPDRNNPMDGSEIRLTWNRITGASSYRIKRLDNGNDYRIIQNSYLGTSYTDRAFSRDRSVTSVSYIIEPLDSQGNFHIPDNDNNINRDSAFLSIPYYGLVPVVDPNFQLRQSGRSCRLSWTEAATDSHMNAWWKTYVVVDSYVGKTDGRQVSEQREILISGSGTSRSYTFTAPALTSEDVWAYYTFHVDKKAGNQRFTLTNSPESCSLSR